MHRRDFQSWGLDLFADDFARALAALGGLHAAGAWPPPDGVKDPLVLEAALRSSHRSGEPWVWRGGFDLPRQAAQPLPARTLADAWKAFLASLGQDLQIEVQIAEEDGPETALWVLRHLSLPAIGAASVYRRADLPRGDASWEWPLRVGFLANDPRSFLLQKTLELDKPGFVRRLTRTVTLGGGFGGLEECDLLLLPYDLPAALARVLSQPRTPVADATLVLGGSSGSEAQTDSLLRTLRETVPGSGVALVSLPGSPLRKTHRDWWVRLIENLSHDASLDRALFSASRANALVPPPILLFARRLVEFHRLSVRIEELAKRLEGSDLAKLEIELPETSVLARFNKPGRVNARELAETLREIRKQGWFDREADGASAMVEVEEALRDRPGTRRSSPSGRGSRRSTISKPRWIERKAAATPRKRSPTRKQRPSRRHREVHGEEKPGHGPRPGRPIEGGPSRELPSATEEEIESAEPESAPKRPPRYLQARMREAPPEPLEPESPEDKESWKKLATFLAGMDHEIRVRVGRKKRDDEEDEGYKEPAAGEVFPVDRLPEQATAHELTVVFSEPTLLPEPQVSSIVLPREDDSTECPFWLHVPEYAERVEGRIVVLHRNRVLQTARLVGKVLPRGQEADKNEGGEGWELQVEAEVRPNLEALEGRRRFDGAMVLNHTTEGSAGLLGFAGDQALAIQDPDLDRFRDHLDDTLSEVAYDRTSYTDGLLGDASVALLRGLARDGARLHRHLIERGRPQALMEALGAAERLQVVSVRTGARLQIELIYDLEPPPKTAKLCLGAKEALRSGRCRAFPGSPDPTSPDSSDTSYPGCPADSGEVVCPLGFWGLRKVIERQDYPRDLSPPDRGDLFVRPEPEKDRDVLPLGGKALHAASHRVWDFDQQGWAHLGQHLLESFPGPANPPGSWQGWAEAIQEEDPDLLVLLVHTEIDGLEQSAEIGDDALDALDLEEEHVRKAGKTGGPLVLLLGCETAAPKVKFLSLPVYWKEAGAALVLAGGSTIHTVHALPMAEALIRQLRQVLNEGGGTFGEVLREVRRHLLAEGHPAVLSLLAFGDADWRLVAASPTNGNGD